MTQPESLRIADNLEKIYGLKAEAAELRRLHEVNAELVKVISHTVAWCEEYGDTRNQWYSDAKKAIAKATGEQQ